VIQIEQHRALPQNAAGAHLPEFCGSELPFIAWSSSGCKLLKLNRQIPKLERHVPYGKQTTQVRSNRQKIQKRARPISKSTNFPSTRDFASPASGNVVGRTPRNGPFSESNCTTSNRFWLEDRSDRTQTIRPCLAGARTAFREITGSSNFQTASAVAYNSSPDHSEGPEFHRKAPRSPSQSSSQSRSYGRS
jgi:hypothetical protein